ALARTRAAGHRGGLRLPEDPARRGVDAGARRGVRGESTPVRGSRARHEERQDAPGRVRRGGPRQPASGGGVPRGDHGGDPVTAFLQHVFDALSAGSTYVLLALGITLLFGVMGLVNFAYGDLIVWSGYLMALLAGWHVNV